MAETLVLDIDYDISKAEAKQKKLTAKFEEQKIKVEQQKKKVLEIAKALEQQLQKEKKIKSILDSKEDVTVAEAEKYEKIVEENKKLAEELKKQQAILNKDVANLEDTGAKIKEISDKSKETNSFWSKFNKNTENTQKSLKKNLTRVKELVKSALIFSVITKAVTAMREVFGEIISKDKQIMQDWNEVKTNLMIIGFQLYDILKPVIQWILNAAKTLTQLISFLITSISGKGAKSAQEIAEAMKETEESVENITAGFDTLQTLSSKETDTTQQSDFIINNDANQKTKAELVKIGTIAGLALIGLGLILTLTGVNIPLGLGMLVAGAVTLYASIVPNWGELSPEVKKQLQEIMLIAGGLMLALGIILLCCGIIPLGLGMVVAGSAALIGSYAVSPDTFVQTVKDVLNKIQKVMDNFVDYVLDNFFEKIFGKPFTDHLRDYYENFKNLWKDVIGLFGDIAEGDWKGAWEHLKNIAVDLIGMIKSALTGVLELTTTLFEKLGDLIGVNLNPDLDDIIKSDIIKPKAKKYVPELATGAVIPGGKPFLAVLGDQKAGQTNIEAPLDTIVEAFKRAQSNNNVTVRFEGSLAALGRVLKPTIDTANKRATAW